MQCIRVMLIGFLIMAGAISSAPPVVADTENAYARRNLVVNRHDPADPTSPPPATIIDPLLLNPWGAAIRSAGLGGHFWLANAASATVTTYTLSPPRRVRSPPGPKARSTASLDACAHS